MFCLSVGPRWTLPSIVSSPCLALLLYLDSPRSVCQPSVLTEVLTLISPALCKPKKPPRRAEPEAGVLSGSSSHPWADLVSEPRRPPGAPSRRGAALGAPSGGGGGGAAGSRARVSASLPASLRPPPPARLLPGSPTYSRRLPRRPGRRHRAARPPQPRHLQTFPGAGAGE